MNSPVSATLPLPANYDNCRINACLRKLFSYTAKSKADTGFRISNHIAEIKKELELVNKEGTLEMSYPYLAAMEKSIPGADFRYAVIYKKDVPVLVVCFQLFTLTSRNFNLEKNKGFVKRIFRFFLDLKKVNVLISGNALRNETACFCFNDAILSRDEAVEIAASAGEKIAADENVAALILKDIPVSARVGKWLAAAGFQMPWEDKVMVMDVDAQWATLNDYIAALSRKYKTRANKILASRSALSVRELTEQDIQHHNPEINALFQQVTDNQSFVLTHPGSGHFPLMKKVYKDDFEVIGFFKGTELVAFYTAFITDDAYELYYVGFDYKLNTGYQLYFNLLFSGLEGAILLKKSKLKLGRTSFDAKASMGARPVAMDYFFKPGNITSMVSKWFANYFSDMEDAKWKLRNPIILDKG